MTIPGRQWFASACLAVGLLLSGCNSSTSFQAYPGEPRPDMEVAVLTGEQYMRQDWINRYIDSVRFARVDDFNIDESNTVNRVEVTPGFHDVTVFYYWDMGTQRRLAPALVQYASSRDTLSRTLRFNARAGERYTVRAEPVFTGRSRAITDLQYVNFRVEDAAGNLVVSREAGRYVPPEQ